MRWAPLTLLCCPTVQSLAPAAVAAVSAAAYAFAQLGRKWAICREAILFNIDPINVVKPGQATVKDCAKAGGCICIQVPGNLALVSRRSIPNPTDPGFKRRISPLTRSHSACERCEHPSRMTFAPCGVCVSTFASRDICVKTNPATQQAEIAPITTTQIRRTHYLAWYVLGHTFASRPALMKRTAHRKQDRNQAVLLAAGSPPPKPSPRLAQTTVSFVAGNAKLNFS